MILRWIYSTWKFIIRTVGIFLLFAVVITVLFLAAIQLPASKDYIKTELEDRFNTQFEGTVEIESIHGFIPFNTELNQVIFYSPIEPYDPQLSAKKIYASVDLWDLIRGNINISALEIHSPDLLLNQAETGLQFTSIFSSAQSIKNDIQPESENRFFKRFSIFAPVITIIDGRVEADETVSLPQEYGFSTPFTVSELNAEFFLESNESQQFLDITSLTAKTSDQDFADIAISGQFFNNEQYLELNGFSFTSNRAVLEITADAEPVNLLSERLLQQLKRANYQLDMQRVLIEPEILHRFNPDFSQFNYTIDIAGLADGTLDSLYVDNLQATTGDSYLIADGLLTKLDGPDFSYNLVLSNLVVSESDLSSFFTENNTPIYDLSAYETPTFQGTIRGDLNQIAVDLDLNTGLGGASFNGEYSFEEIPGYTVSMEIDSLDISPFLKDSVGTSLLNGQFASSGTGIDRDANLETTFDFSNSKIDNHVFNQLTAEMSFSNRSGSYSLQFQEGAADGSASGTFTLGEERRQISTEAVFNQLDITDYLPGLAYETTSLGGRVSASAEGSSADDLFGRISIEMNESIIDADTLRPHQFYADIDEPGSETRTLRMTSSFLDANLTGTIYPGRIESSFDYWKKYLTKKIKQEILFQSPLTEIPPPDDGSSTVPPAAPVDLSLRANAKDLNLLRAYIPALTRLNSSGTLTINLNATTDALSVNGSFYDDSLTVERSSFSDLGLSFTGIVNRGNRLRNNTFADLQINSPRLLLNDRYQIDGTSINMSLRDSLITVEQKIDNALENLSFLSQTTTEWTESNFKTTVNSFTTGSPVYNWHIRGSPVVEYSRDGSLLFDRFIIESQDDYFEMDGTLSNSPSDSLNYSVRNFSLGRISQLVGGRIQFEGVMNGEFTTRSLTQTPSIQGDLSVDGGRINNRVIGDVTLQSRFNSELDRFDTSVRVYTDPDEYSSYLDSNNGIGHDLLFTGYFRAPDDDTGEDEELFYFDADLREIDMWIVSVIVPKIITEMEGRSTGTGFIKGTLSDYDYEASFDIKDVYGRPFFTNVPYNLSGNLVFNRSDGLLFEEIQMDDMQGGSGVLTGQVDLDDFSPLNILDLRIEIDDMRFMNNIQDPNVPFYADLSGTGTAVLEGTSQDPVIRSETPIFLSSNSRISIPLEEETELEQSRRFIQFVESFDERSPLQRTNGRGDTDSGDDEEEIDLTFVELFTMNMQFIANDPIDVQMIFDPVTNDILTAAGTGQIRLILDDQDFSMFGRFNISGGEYQFVGGDIIRRRFNIQDGGSINWQGDLLEANLDVTANFRARPDISTLLPSGANFQRIPVELVLQIGGTISEITNEFYFQIPGGIEGTQDPTITAQINRINQNEDEKVLQAFGILLTGNFVPSDQLQNPESGNITGTNAIVNPFFSSQIINPLLSNQINSLLRSDITFDVDFNLNAFNEVDLGVALRLFDDRIVLRREGQITGDSEIGDIGATYRINRTFSVTAFHRQDPTLSNRADTETRQTQEMNGVGLEAQFQFNTWQSLKRRISNSFRRLFGLKDKAPEVEENTDSSLAEN